MAHLFDHPAYMHLSLLTVSVYECMCETCWSHSSWLQLLTASCCPARSTAECHQNCRQRRTTFRQLHTEQTTTTGYEWLTVIQVAYIYSQTINSIIH